MAVFLDCPVMQLSLKSRPSLSFYTTFTLQNGCHYKRNFELHLKCIYLYVYPKPYIPHDLILQVEDDLLFET